MDVYNEELLQYIRPDTILSWTRCRLSNQLAATGAEWAEVFSMYHSGTCTYLCVCVCVCEGVCVCEHLTDFVFMSICVSD
jgi:Phospholipase B